MNDRIEIVNSAVLNRISDPLLIVISVFFILTAITCVFVVREVKRHKNDTE